MILDHRTYVCKPGMLKAHIALYEKMGAAVQKKHLGEPIVWATTEVGDVNSFVHIWVYKDLADRAAKRARMWADPEWLAYVAETSKLSSLQSQENRILNTTPFMKLPTVA
jgi:hypothetical protein